MGRRAHWIDPQTTRRLDYTKIIPEANIELSGTWQMEFDTEDPATHYQNGIHGFSGRAFGIGPIVTYSTKLGKSHLDLSARWIHDFRRKQARRRQRVQFQRELEILITSKQTANQFNRFHNRKIANACDRIVLENVLRRATISGTACFHWNDGMPLMSPCPEPQGGNVEKL